MYDDEDVCGACNMRECESDCKGPVDAGFRPRLFSYANYAKNLEGFNHAKDRKCRKDGPGLRRGMWIVHHWETSKGEKDVWEGMILRKIENRGGLRSEGGPSYDILYYKDDQDDNPRTAQPYEGVFPVPPRFGRTLGYCVTTPPSDLVISDDDDADMAEGERPLTEYCWPEGVQLQRPLSASTQPVRRQCGNTTQVGDWVSMGGRVGEVLRKPGKVHIDGKSTATGGYWGHVQFSGAATFEVVKLSLCTQSEPPDRLQSAQSQPLPDVRLGKRKTAEPDSRSAKKKKRARVGSPPQAPVAPASQTSHLSATSTQDSVSDAVVLPKKSRSPLITAYQTLYFPSAVVAMLAVFAALPNRLTTASTYVFPDPCWFDLELADEDEDEDDDDDNDNNTNKNKKGRTKKRERVVLKGTESEVKKVKKVLKGTCRVDECREDHTGIYTRGRGETNKNISSSMSRHVRHHKKKWRKEAAAKAKALANSPSPANSPSSPANSPSSPSSNYGFGCATFVQLLAYTFAAQCLPFSLLESGSPFRVLLDHGHELRGANLFPADVARSIDDMAELTRERLFEKLKGKDVSLLLDGATVKRRSFLGYAISDGDNSYFLRAVELKAGSSGSELARQIGNLIDELDSAHINVFSIVADNAPNIQKGIRDMQVLSDYWQLEAEGSESDVDDVDTDDDDTESSDSFSDSEVVDDAINTVFASLGNRKILRYRCSVHGLQLLLKDLTELPRVSDFKDEVVQLVNKYSKFTESRGVLEANQKDANPAITKVRQIKRFTSVRWNSLVDTVKSLTELKKFMHDSDRDKEEFWNAAAYFLKVSSPIAILSDRLQAENSSMFEYAKGISTLLQNYNGELTAAGVEHNFVEESAEMWNALKDRCAKNLVYDGVSMTAFLDPSVDHANVAEHLSLERVDLICEYVVDYSHRRGIKTNATNLESRLDELKERVEQELSTFLSRPVASSHTVKGYWGNVRNKLKMPLVSRFALSLSSSSHSEATVERHFKQLSALLNKKRCSLSSERVSAAMMVSLTHKEIFSHEFTKLISQRGKRTEARVERSLFTQPDTPSTNTTSQVEPPITVPLEKMED